MNLVKFIPATDDKYRKLINRHLDYIEKQCKRAVLKYLPNMSPLHAENESLELNNRIIDKLEKDDYKALKHFKGKSGFTSWLNSVISFELVDMIREKRGRKKSDDSSEDTKPVPGQPTDTDSNSPELLLMETERDDKLREAIKLLIEQLSGEELFILRMKYPPDGSAGMKGDEIARSLNISRKAVYRRLDRIIVKCRKIIEKSELDTETLFLGEKK